MSSSLYRSQQQPIHSNSVPVPQSLRRGPSYYNTRRTSPILDEPLSVDDSDDGSATYYDVLKCKGQFATPSEFFSKPLKPAHSASQAYPWASKPIQSIVGGSSATADGRHRLRRSAASGGGSLASSSVFQNSALDNSLPPSVFRLPGASSNSDPYSWSEQPQWSQMNGMTSGGRSLRRANQVAMSKYDRKVNLV
ncbi:hypothetical protein GGI07_001853 [Coemansia sp. Benny D115]|nr:hypothetical protein GGI07_001853 [Coemansia sp. Benny D115]